MVKQFIEKYEFSNIELFNIAYNLLFNEDGEPNFYFSKPVFVNINLDQKINVDMSWWMEVKEHPNGWADYAINIDTEGLHSFGISYLENKI